MPNNKADSATGPVRKIYALVTDQGTAMSETVLYEDEYTEVNRERVKKNAPDDCDGGDFHDCTGNEALWPTSNSPADSKLELSSFAGRDDCAHKWVSQWSGVKCRLCGRSECF